MSPNIVNVVYPTCLYVANPRNIIKGRTRVDHKGEIAAIL